MEQIEDNISQFDSIENWNEKIIKINETKELIVQEQKKLEELNVQVWTDKLPKSKKMKKKLDLNTLFEKFNNTDDLDILINLYGHINDAINELENIIFQND